MMYAASMLDVAKEITASAWYLIDEECTLSLVGVGAFKVAPPRSN
jgi:hypothetical protein